MRLRRHARREANQQQSSSASASSELTEPLAERSRVRRYRNHEIERSSERLRQRSSGSDQDLARYEATVSRIRNYRPVVRIPRLPISHTLATFRSPRLARSENLQRNASETDNNVSVIDLTSSDTEASIASSIIPPTDPSSSSSSGSSSTRSSDSSDGSGSFINFPPLRIPEIIETDSSPDVFSSSDDEE